MALKKEIKLENQVHFYGNNYSDMEPIEKQELRKKIIKNNENPFDFIVNPLEGNCMYQRALFEALCSGEVQPTPLELAPLRCQYMHGKSMFLKIAPLKLEEISLDPYIVLFHQVASDAEIDFIRNLSGPNVLFDLKYFRFK